MHKLKGSTSWTATFGFRGCDYDLGVFDSKADAVAEVGAVEETLLILRRQSETCALKKGKAPKRKKDEISDRISLLLSEWSRKRERFRQLCSEQMRLTCISNEESELLSEDAQISGEDDDS